MFENENSSFCSSVLPPGARPGDAFGISIAEEDNGSLRVSAIVSNHFFFFCMTVGRFPCEVEA